MPGIAAALAADLEVEAGRVNDEWTGSQITVEPLVNTPSGAGTLIHIGSCPSSIYRGHVQPDLNELLLLVQLQINSLSNGHVTSCKDSDRS
ncbi:hypothetical protein EJB05_08919, partial [Eragrostis curvula]